MGSELNSFAGIGRMMRSTRFFIVCLVSGVLWSQEGFEQPPPTSSGTQNRVSSSIAISKKVIETAPPDKEEAGFVFRAEVSEVSLHATVTDKKKRLVTSLDRNAFRVFEDDKPQVITSFRHEDAPVVLGIVIDNSGSMLDKRDRVNRAALNLVQASNRDDEVFVLNFNDHYYLDQDFTDNLGKLEKALEKMQSTGGTALYDALVAAAEHLKRSELQRKILVVVTDGEDNESNQSLESTVEVLQHENGPTVYAIGILSGPNAKPARRALETIAERTGGMAFMPRTADGVDSISETVAHDIRTQYTLEYKPSKPPSDGGYRHIRVEAHASGYKDLHVRTRTGYYAGKDRAAR